LKILFDHNVDRRFRKHLPGHEIKTTREMRWETLTNGMLLRAAAGANFDALLTIDKKLEHEQNLQTLPLPVIVLDTPSNALPALLVFAPFVLDLLQSPLDKLLYLVQPSGTVLRLSSPRP
jgi:hypothetical protein